MVHHRLHDVSHGNDSCGHDYLAPLESEGVTGTVHSFVVLQCHLDNRPRQRRSTQNIRASLTVTLDHFILERTESPRLGQDFRRHRHLADVVDFSAQFDETHHLVVETEMVGQCRSQTRYVDLMTLRVGITLFGDLAQRLSRAFTNWKKGTAKFPTLKKRQQGGSVRFTNTAVRLTDSHHVRVSRIGELKTYESTRKLYRHLERGDGRILAATITERRGAWTVAFSVEVQRAVAPTRPPERIIGIDVGLATLYTGATPEGNLVLDVANPHHLVAAEKRLAHAQRIAARRQGPRKGVAPSNRWKKSNARVQKVHASVTNSRKNLIHETTTMLAKNYDLIVVEDLNVKGMMKNHSLAKHIADASWGEFTRQLEYKTKWYGSAVVKAGRFYPSSKTCSHCQTVKAKLSQELRTYHCEACGLTLDRDVNAAINLARQGLAGTDSVTGRGGEVRPGRLNIVDQAHPDEASTETPPEVGA